MLESIKHTDNIDNYFDKIAAMAYEKYCEEVRRHPCLMNNACSVKRTKESYADFFREKLQGMHGVIGLENDIPVGFLFYTLQEEDALYCNIPVWGYSARGEKCRQIISRLFQSLAEQIVSAKTVHFSVRLYAHDEEMQRLFSFLQFGIQSEKGIRRIEEIAYNPNHAVRKISKEELRQKWAEIWDLLSQLISHLQKSPVFYPGKEFTEEVYQEFFADTDTSVYIMEDKDKITGVIESNSETMDYFFPNIQAVNVGKAYVVPEYRGQKAAQALLHCLDKDLAAAGAGYEWVEHGTANPTARGFWNKYFETVEYEFIRSIER